ncbi:MerR family transcriptional regulator [Sanguibacter sp. YZGR15]|uniref:MerR family transcriptional regulator n=2 Tax=Sanguibacter suaedae TaxID=2795737 RepID=A0A934I1E5_9MICO|nr:MerR family transcriptional regulator [Sanguibacter suaedae]
MHPQTLRQYDRLGLVTPSRTSGRGRRYSRRDVVQLIEVQRLSQEEGINLAGIRRILALESEVRRLEHRVELLAAAAEPGSRIFTAALSGDVVAVRAGQRTRRGARGRAQGETTPAERAALVVWRPQR